MPSQIEWCDETLNPIIGCSPKSDGCKNCYAQTMAQRLAGMPQTKKDYSQVQSWNGSILFRPKELLKLATFKDGSKIFLCSMGDLFHINIHDSYVKLVLKYIRYYSNLTFILLTKRPQRMKYFLTIERKLPNLWAGVTCENQPGASKRIRILSTIPVKVKFISCEPLLENIDLRIIPGISSIRWVICGAETGTGARPMDTAWARSLKDQAQILNVPFFMKKMSKKKPIPKELNIKEFPKCI